jgi:hypothetical protein
VGALAQAAPSQIDEATACPGPGPGRDPATMAKDQSAIRVQPVQKVSRMAQLIRLLRRTVNPLPLEALNG